MLDRANTLGNLRLELQETTLTERMADELRSFILSLEPRACLIQPDMVEVFDVDEAAVDRIIAKLGELGVNRVLPTAPAPKEKL